MTPVRVSWWRGPAELDLDVDRIGICQACLSFVSMSLKDPKEARHWTYEMTPFIWEEGLKEPALAAVRRLGDVAALADLEANGGRSKTARAIVMHLARRAGRAGAPTLEGDDELSKQSASMAAMATLYVRNVPAELYAKLQAWAAETGDSLNAAIVCEFLEREVERRERRAEYRAPARQAEHVSARRRAAVAGGPHPRGP